MNAVASILYAVAISVLSALALWWCNGTLSPWIAFIALGSGAAFGIVSFICTTKTRDRLPRIRGWAWLPVLLFALFSLRCFLWLLFREGDELRVLSPNNLGDLSLHLTFINYFANGASFWPDNPIFAQGKLSYAIGSDLFNSLLTLAGVDVERGLIWCGLVGSVLTGAALMRWGGAFTLAGFLFNGGLLGFAAFTSNGPFFQDYAGLMKYDWAWKSIPLAIFVTQRGFLFALPAGLLLLTSWRTRFFHNGMGWRMPFAGELLLYASMPLFHVHTFIVLSFFLAIFFVLKIKARKSLTILIASALLPATLLLWLTLGMMKTGAVTHSLGWQPGWMVNEENVREVWNTQFAQWPSALEPWGRFLIFWFGNFGIWPITMLLLLLVCLRLQWPLKARWMWLGAFVLLAPLCGQSAVPLVIVSMIFLALAIYLSKHWKDSLTPVAFVIPALFLFFLCCNVKFAVWDWDNTKLMLWCYLIPLPFLWQMLLSRWSFWKRGMVCVLLFFSGFVTLIGGMKGNGYPIAKLSTLDAVNHAVKDIPITETFAAAPHYAHPLLLCGRKCVVGFSGHLISHGIQSDRQEALLSSLMTGTPEWRRIATELGVRYLYFGVDEKEQWPDSHQAWRQETRIIESGPWGGIYDLKSVQTTRQ
jgi:hypothetical protein